MKTIQTINLLSASFINISSRSILSIDPVEINLNVGGIQATRQQGWNVKVRRGQIIIIEHFF
jgi:hypothetical protein